MIDVDIPGHGRLKLEHLVLDYNGTLAVDGNLLPNVAAAIRELSKDLRIRVITADTFGKVRAQMEQLPVEVTVLPSEQIHLAKLAFIRALGPDLTVAIGNGRNDREMLKHAALGICVLQEEGAAVETLLNARIAVSNVVDGLNLLLFPRRLVATLRS